MAKKEIFKLCLHISTEKNLKVLKEVLAVVPNSRLVFVGDGPERQELEQHYQGCPVTFMVCVGW